MTQTATGGLARIRQIALAVRDLDAAIVFYRDRLGMRFLFRTPPGLWMAFFRDPDGNPLAIRAERPKTV